MKSSTSLAVVRSGEPAGSRSEPTGGGERSTAARPDPEVPAKATRRQFSAKYKLRILREVEACTEPGAVGAVLRREGLYSSHLTSWRKQRAAGELRGLSPRKRGRKRSKAAHSAKEVEQLRRENERLRRQLAQAEVIIGIPKKASEILGIPLRSPDDEGSD